MLARMPKRKGKLLPCWYWWYGHKIKMINAIPMVASPFSSLSFVSFHILKEAYVNTAPSSIPVTTGMAKCPVIMTPLTLALHRITAEVMENTKITIPKTPAVIALNFLKVLSSQFQC